MKHNCWLLLLFNNVEELFRAVFISVSKVIRQLLAEIVLLVNDWFGFGFTTLD